MCLPSPSLVVNGQVKEALKEEANARDVYARAYDVLAQAENREAQATEAWVRAGGSCGGSTARCFEQAAESRERARKAVENREWEKRGAENRRRAAVWGEKGYQNVEGWVIWPDKEYAREMVKAAKRITSFVRNAAHEFGTNVTASKNLAKHIRILTVQNPPNALQLLHAAQVRDTVAQAWDVVTQAWSTASDAWDAATQAWDAAAQALERAADSIEKNLPMNSREKISPGSI